jgi:hypothetical protein
MPEDQAKPERPPIWVSAFSCREVLRERNDLLTAVRISDGFTAHPLQFPGLQVDNFKIYTPIEFKIVAAFTCEEEATFDISIKALRPTGEVFTEMPSFPASHVQGGAHGLTLSINAMIPGNPPGVYWFEIYVDDELRLKLPVGVAHQNQDPFPRSEIAKNSQAASPEDPER